MRKLRALETDLDFQAKLLVEQHASARTSGYSRSNFAYGSTPLTSWLTLFKSAPVQAAVARRRLTEDSRPRYVVLGSSLGSLCIFGACVYGLPTLGIELMPMLTAQAESIAREAQASHVHFTCADMLQCDLSGADIVLLASQCWDEELVTAVGIKLLAELDIGALALDYTPALGHAGRKTSGESTGTHGRRFELQCKVSAPVSWDGAHSFFVWQVVEAD